jgi:disulfide bond formation protein DsbB
MVLIALVGLFVLRYGPRPRYLGMAILLGAWGTFMALRHSALHLARDVGQGFAAPIFGVHTYAWSWVIHFVALAVIGVLLLLMRDGFAEWSGQALTRLGRFTFALFLVVVGANALQAIVTTGPPPFIGQADPVRFSLNPKRWTWSMEELRGRVSVRGSWTIPDPQIGEVNPDPADGPLADLPVLPITRWESLGVQLDGNLTDLASGPQPRSAYLAVTDRYGVYLLDSALSRVLHRVVLDHQFAIDLTPLAGAALMGDTMAVVATNKSHVLLRPDPAADPDTAWRRFLATDGQVTELRRSRFQTVRARQQYVLSLAYDPAADELITISVPSPRHQRLVVSRFARSDFLLSSEFEPARAAWLTLIGADRSLAEYVVTGAAVADGLLYAISAAYSTLLVIDLTEQVIRAAYAVPGLERPVGLALRGPDLIVAQQNGRLATLPRPVP